MNHNNSRLTNGEFLKIWQQQGPTEAILAHEYALIEARLEAMQDEYDHIIASKKAVSGGDDWHDGAFRATDSAASALVKQHAELLELLRLPRVELPEPSQTTVSLGSRVHLSQNRRTPYNLNIVGTSRLYPSDGDIEIATVLSPLGRTLIGHKMGEVIVDVLVAGRRQTIEILDSNPMEPIGSDNDL